MVQCWAFNCSHNSMRDNCRMFKLPKERKLRSQWLKNIGKPTVPLPKVIQICSCHFKDGDKKNVPDIFTYPPPSDKQFPPHYCSPERKKPRSSLVSATSSVNLIVVTLYKNVPLTSMELATTSTPVNCKQTPSKPSFSSPSFSCGTTSIEIKSEDMPSTSRDTKPEEKRPPPTFSALMEAENYFLQKEIEELKSKKSKASLNVEELDDKMLLFYTGIPKRKMFDMIYELVQDVTINYLMNFTVNKLTRKEQLFMTLMKFRQNFSYADLALRFSVSKATVCNVILTWIHVLHEVLYQYRLKSIPSRNTNKFSLPNCSNTFTNCRIILDCMEIDTMVSRQSTADIRAAYRSHQHKNTLKGLVGVAPNGSVTFLSDLYPGSTSEKNIIEKCGIINQFEAGDVIFADKHFLIRDILPDDVHLNVPQCSDEFQFTQKQIRDTEKIAKVHVERAIRRIKSFKILNCIPYRLLQHSSKLFKIIGALINLHDPLAKEVDEYDQE